MLRFVEKPGTCFPTKHHRHGQVTEVFKFGSFDSFVILSPQSLCDKFCFLSLARRLSLCWLRGSGWVEDDDDDEAKKKGVPIGGC